MTRTTPDVEESPATTEWRDEPTNPFPKGTFEPFDSSRMFDPTYRSSEERPSSITKSSSSRTMRRKPKADPYKPDPFLEAEARKTFF
jgi:hypothetical protein